MAYTGRPTPKKLLIRYQHLAIRAGYKHTPSNGRGPDWLPDRRSGFEHLGDTGWLLWNGESLRRANDLSRRDIVQHSQSTLFWCPQAQRCYHVPYDCSTEDVSVAEEDDVRSGWQPIMFERPQPAVQKLYPNLYLIGRHLREPAINMLTNSSIAELLSPSSFVNGQNGARESYECDLAGDLSLLYGLVAMTIPFDEQLPTRFADALRLQSDNSFLYVPTGQRGLHPAEGLTRHRGLVVKIAFESSAHTKQELDNYKHGQEGAIFRGCPVTAAPRSVPPSHQANAFATYNRG